MAYVCVYTSVHGAGSVCCAALCRSSARRECGACFTQCVAVCVLFGSTWLASNANTSQLLALLFLRLELCCFFAPPSGVAVACCVLGRLCASGCFQGERGDGVSLLAAKPSTSSVRVAVIEFTQNPPPTHVHHHHHQGGLLSSRVLEPMLVWPKTSFVFARRVGPLNTLCRLELF